MAVRMLLSRPVLDAVGAFAACADSQEFDSVGYGGEAVFARGAAGPAFHRVFSDFNGVSAKAADQVVVMVPALAATVAGFGVLGSQHVDFALVRHGLQNPIDGGQGDRFPVRAQHGVQLLGAAEFRGLFQHLVEGRPLPRHPFHTRCLP